MPADEQDFWPHHPHVSSVVIYCCCCCWWCINPILGFFRIGHGPIILPTLSHASCPPPPPVASINGWSILSSWSFCYCCCSWDPPTHPPTHPRSSKTRKKEKKRKTNKKQIKNKSMRLVLVGLCLEWWNLFLTVSCFFLSPPSPKMPQSFAGFCRLLEVLWVQNMNRKLCWEREREKKIQKPLQ